MESTPDQIQLKDFPFLLLNKEEVRRVCCGVILPRSEQWLLALPCIYPGTDRYFSFGLVVHMYPKTVNRPSKKCLTIKLLGLRILVGLSGNCYASLRGRQLSG